MAKKRSLSSVGHEVTGSEHGQPSAKKQKQQSNGPSRPSLGSSHGSAKPRPSLGLETPKSQLATRRSGSTLPDARRQSVSGSHEGGSETPAALTKTQRKRLRRQGKNINSPHATGNTAQADPAVPRASTTPAPKQRDGPRSQATPATSGMSKPSTVPRASTTPASKLPNGPRGNATPVVSETPRRKRKPKAELPSAAPTPLGAPVVRFHNDKPDARKGSTEQTAQVDTIIAVRKTSTDLLRQATTTGLMLPPRKRWMDDELEADGDESESVVEEPCRITYTLDRGCQTDPVVVLPIMPGSAPQQVQDEQSLPAITAGNDVEDVESSSSEAEESEIHAAHPETAKQTADAVPTAAVKDQQSVSSDSEEDESETSIAEANIQAPPAADGINNDASDDSSEESDDGSEESERDEGDVESQPKHTGPTSDITTKTPTQPAVMPQPGKASRVESESNPGDVPEQVLSGHAARNVRSPETAAGQFVQPIAPKEADDKEADSDASTDDDEEDTTGPDPTTQTTGEPPPIEDNSQTAVKPRVEALPRPSPALSFRSSLGPLPRSSNLPFKPPQLRRPSVGKLDARTAFERFSAFVGSDESSDEDSSDSDAEEEVTPKQQTPAAQKSPSEDQGLSLFQINDARAQRQLAEEAEAAAQASAACIQHTQPEEAEQVPSSDRTDEQDESESSSSESSEDDDGSEDDEDEQPTAVGTAGGDAAKSSAAVTQSACADELDDSESETSDASEDESASKSETGEDEVDPESEPGHDGQRSSTSINPLPEMVELQTADPVVTTQTVSRNQQRSNAKDGEESGEIAAEDSDDSDDGDEDDALGNAEQQLPTQRTIEDSQAESSIETENSEEESESDSSEEHVKVDRGLPNLAGVQVDGTTSPVHSVHEVEDTNPHSTAIVTSSGSEEDSDDENEDAADGESTLLPAGRQDPSSIQDFSPVVSDELVQTMGTQKDGRSQSVRDASSEDDYDVTDVPAHPSRAALSLESPTEDEDAANDAGTPALPGPETPAPKRADSFLGGPHRGAGPGRARSSDSPSPETPGTRYAFADEISDVSGAINDISSEVFGSTRSLPPSKQASPVLEGLDAILTRKSRHPQEPSKEARRRYLKEIWIPQASQEVFEVRTVRFHGGTPDPEPPSQSESLTPIKSHSAQPAGNSGVEGMSGMPALAKRQSSDSLSDLGSTPSPPPELFQTPQSPSRKGLTSTDGPGTPASGDESKGLVGKKRKMTGMTSKHFTPEKKQRKPQKKETVPDQSDEGTTVDDKPAVDAATGAEHTENVTPSSRRTEPRPSKAKRKSTGTKSEHFLPFHLLDRVDLPSPSKKRAPAGVSIKPIPPITSERFGIIQEKLWEEPFWLLIAVTFLNKTTGRAAGPIFWNIKKEYPTPEDLSKADFQTLFDTIRSLGFGNQRALRLIAMSKTWIGNPAVAGQRYRTKDYPEHACHTEYNRMKDQAIEGDMEACKGSLEIGHMPGCGAYAYDSWRIFCRDVLRGVATGYNGEGTAGKPDFQPEWQRVLPMDKELRAALRWMWLREGWIWNHETGDKRKATDEEMEKALRGEMEMPDAQERKFAAQAVAAETPKHASAAEGTLDATPAGDEEFEGGDAKVPEAGCVGQNGGSQEGAGSEAVKVASKRKRSRRNTVRPDTYDVT